MQLTELTNQLSEVSHTPEAEARFILEEYGDDSDSIYDAISERKSGKPLQYIFGSWKFRNLNLLLDERVLIPRLETEITVDVALRCLSEFVKEGLTALSVCRVLDVGCGSGAIGLSILKEGSEYVENHLKEHFTNKEVRLEITLSDISNDALEVARINYEQNFNMVFENATHNPPQFLKGSWFEALQRVGESNYQNKFHLIVSNPPYISSGEDLPREVESYEPRVALRSGKTGCEDLSHIILNASPYLADDGWLVLELAPHQADELAMLAEATYKNVSTERDLAGRKRVLVCQKI